MNFVEFNKKDTKIEKLYDTVDDTLSVMDYDGNVYHNCTISWEQGRTRSAVFDNYRFNHQNGTIWPEDVSHIALEDEEKDIFIDEHPEESND